MAPSWQRSEVTLAPSDRPRDLELAGRFGVPLAERRDPARWQIVRSPTGLELCSPDAMGGSRLDLDVNSGPLARRLRSARRDEPLARAIGLPKRQSPPAVLDATAGLCRDAMVLAHLGCEVTAIERVPALAMLAAAAVEAAGLSPRLRVETGEAQARLQGLPADRAPDVVYLDPMFETTGRAQVKKDLQICRLLVGEVGEAAELTGLLAVARAAARERVVVKRHPDLGPLAPGVSFAVAGERIRFDVYLTPTPTPGTPAP
jgi:16S rRNA (guanine1516-N2)-methyltransferase